MITKKKIRKVFSPLTVTVSTVTSGSAAQIYDSMRNTWTPDRNQQPFVIRPKVIVTTEASDNTWVNGDYASKLHSVKWYANGEKIYDDGTMTKDHPLYGKFTVSTDAKDFGAITISKNFSPSESYDLVMGAELLDTRNNLLIPIRTDAVHMTVSERTANEWDLSVAHDTNVCYHPLLDLLKEYDWKVANGKMTANNVERAKCYNGNQYDLTLPIIISRGAGVISSSDRDWSRCTIKVYIKTDSGFMEYGTSDSMQSLSFITKLSKEEMGVDLRLVPGGTVMEVALFVDGVKMASEFMTFSLIIDNYSCEPSNEGDLDPNAKYRYDRALCMVNGRKLEYPEAYLDIRWYTNSSNINEVYHGNGEKVNINIANAQIGTAEDCWIEVYTVSLVKALVAVITIDDDGKVILTTTVGNKQVAITSDMLIN